MSVPGQLTFDHLLKTIERGWVPSGRVLLQEINPDGSGGSKLREVHGWSTINVSRNLRQRGRAMVSFGNIDDRIFSNGYDRSSSFNQTVRISANLDTANIQGYISDVLKRSLPYVRELNPQRRLNDRKGFQGLRKFGPQDIQNYLSFLFNFDGWFSTKNFGDLKTRPDFSRDLVRLGLMQRIFIDVQGPDGLWYALFSGIVSGIADRMVPGQMPTVDLVCYDYWRLFEVTELIVQEGPGLQQIEDTIFFKLQQKLGLRPEPYRANVFDGVEGIDIINKLVKLVDSMYAFVPYLSYTNDILAIPDGLIPDFGTGDISRTDFFNIDGLFEIQGTANPTYRGHLNLRSYSIATVVEDAFDDSGNRIQLDGKPAFNVKGFQLPGVEDGQPIPEGLPIAHLVAKVQYDANLFAGAQGEAYRLTVNRIMGLWQSQKMPASSIIKRLVDSTFYDCFFSPNGDLIYQIPKFNNFPGEYSLQPAVKAQVQALSANDVAAATDVGTKIQTDISLDQSLRLGPTQIPTSGNFYDFSQSGTYDFAPPGYFASQYHGFNWIITDLGLHGWNFTSSEEPIVTALRVPTQPDWIQLGNGLDTLIQTGRTPLSVTETLQRRFGVRARETSVMFLKTFFGSDPNSRSVLDAFALSLMYQMNSSSYAGSVNQTLRPDIDLGNNLLIIERQRLMYVTGIEHKLTNGKEASTTIQLGYGHHYDELIPNPFLDLTNQAVAIQDKPLPTVSESTNIQNSDKPAEKLQQPTAPATTGGTVVSGTTITDRFAWRLTTYFVIYETDPQMGGTKNIPLLLNDGSVIKNVTPVFFMNSAIEGTGFLDTAIGANQFINVSGLFKNVDSSIYAPLFLAFLTSASVRISKKQAQGLTLEAARRSVAPIFGIVLDPTATKVIQVMSFVLQSAVAVAASSAGPASAFKTLAADIGTTSLSEPFYKGSGGLVSPKTRVYMESFKGISCPDDNGNNFVHDGWFTVNDTGSLIFGKHFDIYTGSRANRFKVSIPSFSKIYFEGIDGKLIPLEKRDGGSYKYGLTEL